MDNKILKLLYRSFDDELNPEEKERLDRALEESEEIRKEKEQILAQRQALAGSSAPSFKPFFPEQVMNRIESLGKKKNGFESFYETLLLMFRRFAIVGAAILLILLIYNLQSGDILSSEEILYASDFTFEEILNLPLF
jgi:anti-sigma factor RsiW